MASLALGVVIRRNPVYCLVRIMTRHAANSRVIHIETLAVGETVRLEPDVTYPVRSMFGHKLPCPVAAAAKLGAVFRAHRGQFLHRE